MMQSEVVGNVLQTCAPSVKGLAERLVGEVNVNPMYLFIYGQSINNLHQNLE